jgi:predicted transcriptional regulator
MDYEMEGQESRDKMNLLILVSELKSVLESNAAIKLEMAENLVSQLAEELEYEGLINVDKTGGDPEYKISEEGKKRIKKLHKEIQREEEEREKAEKPKISYSMLVEMLQKRVDRIIGRVKYMCREGLHETILLALVLSSAYLIYVFLRNPNTQVFSFLYATIILSFSLLLYRDYRNELKTDAAVNFIEWRIRFIKKHGGHIFTLLSLVSLVYAVGMIVMDPDRMDVYIMLAAFLVSTSTVFYTAELTVKNILKFYAGVLLLTYSLLLITGASSVTETVLNYFIRIVDLGVGLVVMVIVYINRQFFGVNIESLKEMLYAASRPPTGEDRV